MIPRRIQRSRARGSKLPPNTICVTRPGRWGNPFVVGELPPWNTNLVRNAIVDVTVPMLGREAVLFFEGWLDNCSKGRAMVTDARQELRGHNLACWCRLCPKHRQRGKPWNVVCVACAPCHSNPLMLEANGSKRLARWQKVKKVVGVNEDVASLPPAG